MSVTGAAYQEDPFRPLTDGAEARRLGKSANSCAKAFITAMLGMLALLLCRSRANAAFREARSRA